MKHAHLQLLLLLIRAHFILGATTYDVWRAKNNPKLVYIKVKDKHSIDFADEAVVN